MTRASPKIMASCRGAFLGVALLSGLINILYLSGSIFMMEVYDRVLPSRSIPTLVGLSVIIVVLYLFQGLFDMIRGRILARIGAAADEESESKSFSEPTHRTAAVWHRRETDSNLCATSTRSGLFWQAAGPRHCSICRGCRFICSSALLSIP